MSRDNYLNIAIVQDVITLYLCTMKKTLRKSIMLGSA